MVRAREPRVSAQDDRLRPLVDARIDARAERADARFGVPLGRHTDCDQARRPPRISGPVALAGDAKTVWIAAAAATDSSRRLRSAAGMSGRMFSSATSDRSPVRRQSEPTIVRSPTN